METYDLSRGWIDLLSSAALSPRPFQTPVVPWIVRQLNRRTSPRIDPLDLLAPNRADLGVRDISAIRRPFRPAVDRARRRKRHNLASIILCYADLPPVCGRIERLVSDPLTIR